MTSSKLPPEEPFPEDLAVLDDEAVEVLNSKVHRQIDAEYAEEGEVEPETSFRHEELTEELDQRDEDPGLSLVPEIQAEK
ncbi:hypothetical protein [Arthrobacter sp. Br18]|uniref:hypothetical protein n=1 Tax=Arthrobacter sp. Br18 TaxID=1312954 RepID=UPI0004ADF184|nr:hypothetical protein [Arthrobacter sp. Br18]